MNSFSKSLVTFAVVISIIGIAMLIAGIILGAKLGDISDMKNKTVAINEIYENIDKLSINLKYGDIKIKRGDTFKIEGNVPEKISLETEVKNGEWIIKDNNKKIISLFDFNFNSNFNGEYEVTIYIPENELDKINIDIGACNLNIEDLNAKDIYINVGAGSVGVNNLTSNYSSIECGAGKIDIKKATLSKADISCGVGKIDLTILGKQSDYGYDVNTGIGEVKVGDNTYSGMGKNEKIKSSNNDKKLNIDCGIGSIEINFEEE